jgi:hypothetical protein
MKSGFRKEGQETEGKACDFSDRLEKSKAFLLSGRENHNS